VVFAGQNMGSPAVNGDGILHTPVSPRLTPSSSFSPCRRSDPLPSITATRFDDGILPTPHVSTHLPSPSSLRRSGSFPTRSGLPQQASSAPVSRSSPSHLGAHPLSFSPLPSLEVSLSSPISLLPSRLFQILPPSSHPCLRFLLHFTLFFFTFVTSHSFCAMSFLSSHRLSLCVFV